MKRAWIKLRSYFRPSWRTLTCPRCGVALTARSGPHMTEAVGAHNRACHPESFGEIAARMQEVFGVDLMMGKRGGGE